MEKTTLNLNSQVSSLSSYSKKNALIVHNIENEPNGDLMFEMNPNLNYFSARSLFLARSNDILVLDFNLGSEYLDYLFSLGVEVPTIINLENEEGNSFNEKFESFILNNRLNINKKKFIYSPFYVNSKDFSFSKKLGISFMGSRRFKLYDFMYNKFNFSKMCEKKGVPSLDSLKLIISSNSVLSIEKELLKILKYFDNEEVLLRETNGAGGIGIYTLNLENVSNISKELSKYTNLEYIAQKKYKLNSSPSVIGSINAKSVTLFAQTEQLFNPDGKYLGNIIDLNKFNSQLKEITKQITTIKQNLGYRGFFGIDFIETSNGNFFPVEDNARVTNSMILYNILVNFKERKSNFDFGISTVFKINPINFKDFKRKYEHILNLGEMSDKVKTILTNPILLEDGSVHLSIVGEKEYVLQHLNYLLHRLS